ncbi:hypothetical protein BC830DRAFT_1219877 [Chytriomyces sp. MP71]|nr:hypothetical protein BC830DRAFT_1219877 [Chytriomyces sp. MP71]
MLNFTFQKDRHVITHTTKELSVMTMNHLKSLDICFITLMEQGHKYWSDAVHKSRDKATHKALRDPNSYQDLLCLNGLLKYCANRRSLQEIFSTPMFMTGYLVGPIMTKTKINLPTYGSLVGENVPKSSRRVRLFCWGRDWVAQILISNVSNSVLGNKINNLQSRIGLLTQLD